MMLWPFSKRRTMPRMSCPWRSLYSLKMMSRSASRTRWKSTCLAVCAAMRPKALRACFMSSTSPNSLSCWRACSASRGCQNTWKPSSSPSSASRPCLRATSSAISRSGSVTSSTTVMYWKRSTWPVSSLKRASSSRVGPNAACAALRIAASIVSIRTFLSMPFSWATCSTIVPRSTSKPAACAAMAFTFRSRPPGGTPAAVCSPRRAFAPGGGRSGGAPVEHQPSVVDYVELDRELASFRFDQDTARIVEPVKRSMLNPLSLDRLAQFELCELTREPL